MHLDVADLRDFYARPLGGVVRRLLGHRIRARWRQVTGLTVIGLGFPVPFIGGFRGEALRLGAFMPAEQGAIVGPTDGPSHSVLVDEAQLPLPDNCVDRLLAVHCLEFSERGRVLLREMWRVLAPEGRLLLIVPNRRGIWARSDHTPFGHGRPFSRGQLERLLVGALFSPLDWGHALHLPPI
ncbi:MAG: methyltransferase domain-containing protein, partial [Hyphomicrobiaceae bacterium]